MISGVATYRFVGSISAHNIIEYRVLVLNRHDVRDAITVGALEALASIPDYAREWRLEVTDFVRIRFDSIA